MRRPMALGDRIGIAKTNVSEDIADSDTAPIEIDASDWAPRSGIRCRSRHELGLWNARWSSTGWDQLTVEYQCTGAPSQ